MKAGVDLQALAAEIERQRNTKRDFKASTSELTLIDETEDAKGALALKINGHGTFGVTELCHDQIAAHHGIPAKYYDKMRHEAPELLVRNVNHWFDATKDTRMLRTLDGRARAFLSNRYRSIDNDDVATAVLPMFLEQSDLGLKLESCQVTETRLYIKAVSERIVGKVVGDVVQSGICITNSEVGLHAFKIEPLVYVLRCTNGMVLNDARMRRYHVGRRTEELETAVEVFADDTRKADDQALMLKMRDVVKACFDQVKFNEMTRGLEIVAGNKLQRNLVDTADKVVEVFQIADRHKDGILAQLAGHAKTRWGLSNALTAYAQDDALDYDEASRFEELGGEVMTLSNTKWEEVAGVAA